MNLTLTTEQEELRETVARFLTAKAPVRAFLDTESGFDPEVWSQLAEQLGLLGLAIPTAYGGFGYGAVEQYLVLHEMGRTLYSGPYLACVLASAALLNAGNPETCAEFLPAIASGATVATLAWAENASWHASARTVARQVGEGWFIDGEKTLVLGIPAADLFLVTARTPAGTGLFAVPAARTIVRTTVLDSLDLTRRLGTVRFAAAPATLVCPDASTVVGPVLEYAYAAQAAEQSGGARQCLDMSVEYAKTRTQFGAPIGANQAVAHSCADMLLLAEHARAAAHYAAAAHGTPDYPIAARVAGAYASEAYETITTATIHVHGGIGFTWEHDAHLHYRRARSAAQLFANPDQHYENIATLAGL